METAQTGDPCQIVDRKVAFKVGSMKSSTRHSLRRSSLPCVIGKEGLAGDGLTRF